MITPIPAWFGAISRFARQILLLGFCLITFYSFSQPTISGFSPVSGPIGSSVVISGANFSNLPSENTVYFGAVKATVVNASGNSLIVTVPTGATCKPISVSVNNLTALSKDAFVLTFPAGVPNGKDFLPSSLTSGSIFPTGNGSLAYEAASGDFDGDGKPDIVFAHLNNRILSVFRNNSTLGNVSFSPNIDISMGAGSNRGMVLTADVDGDTKLDLVTISGNNTVSIFRNTTSGSNISFAPKVDLTLTMSVGGIAVADFNGDGKLDISAVSFSNTVTIFKGTGAPGTISFASPVDFATGSGPTYVVGADMDGDNKTDLVVVNNTSKTISILRNTSSNGVLSFDPKVDFTILTAPAFVSVGDLDEDGKPEVVITSGTSPTTSYVSIFKNTSTTGTVSLASRIDIASAGVPRGIAISDVNGDGKPEISLANYGGRSVSIFKNTSTSGALSFATRVDYNTDSITAGICVVDVDGDGINDIAVSAGNSLMVFKSKFEEPFIQSFTPTTGNAGNVITITGLNFNNVTSVSIGGVPISSYTIISPTTISAVVGNIGIGTMSVSVTNPYGTHSLSGFYSGLTITSFGPQSGTVGTTVTITGEHFSPNIGDNIVYFGAVRASVTSATTSSLSVTVPVGATYTPLTVTTGNVTAQANKPFNVTFPGGGTPFNASSFTMLPNISTQTYSPFHIATGDLDGDGKADIVISHVFTSTISVHRNITIGGVVDFSSQIYSVGSGAGSSGVGIALGDIDGDGKLDIISSHEGSGIVSVFRNTSSVGSITFATRVDFTYYDGVSDIMVVDIDGDRKPDIVVTGPNSIMSILRNKTNGNQISFDPAINFSLNAAGVALASGDFDGDGKMDIAVSAGNISIFRNTSTIGVPFSQSSFATRLDFSASDAQDCGVGDIDGDGKPDIVTASRGSHTLSVLRNTSAGGSLSFASKVDFNAASIPLGVNIVDLDGDGKPDLSTAKFGSADVSILRNTGSVGSVAFQSRVNFQASNEVVRLAEGDFDNDGRPDLAVANYSGNAITILMNRIGTSPLPLHLSSLSVRCAGAGKELLWSTANELNTDRFEIENSTDGSDWFKIGTVKAAGLSSNEKKYSFSASGSENNFYRLKIIDNDGKFSYSNVVYGKCDNSNPSMLVFPQPAKNNLTIKYSAAQSGKTEVQIIDMMGRVLMRRNFTSILGENKVQINISELAGGEYFVTIIQDSQTNSHRLTIAY